MSNIDPTFLWETEALRERRTATRSSSREGTGSVAVATVADARGETPDEEPGFVSLVAASEMTGIPVNTLRKWARRGAVVSYLDETQAQPVRMVSLDAVRSRAASLGREISALAAAPGPPPPVTGPRVTVDLTEPAAAPAPAAVTPPGAAPSSQPVPSEAATVPPPGTMIVPISAWEKMLNQLGNLHEAGREMAEARERAARAETEATFLRERLKELRAELATANDLPAEGPTPAPPDPFGGRAAEPSPATPDAAESPESREPFDDFLRRTFRNLRKRLRG